MRVDLVDGPLHALLERGILAGHFPGCAAGWSSDRDDGIVVDVAGVSRFGKGRTSVTAETWYDLASLTKPLVVTTLFLLARRGGALELARTVGEILPAAGPWKGVSVENLLTHTAGLPGWAPLYALGHSPGDVLAALRDLNPIYGPGERFEYSCPGFILMGLVLEEVLGGGLAAAFRDMVAVPLGIQNDLSFEPCLSGTTVAGGAAMPDAEITMLKSLGLDPSLIPRCASHKPDDGNARFLGGVAGNSGLWGTVRGVLLMGREYLPGCGRLLNTSESELASAARTPTLDQHRGLGWQLASSPGSSAGDGLSPNSIGHVGFTGTSIWIDRRRGRILTLLANRHHPGHRGNDLHPLRRRFHSLVMS